MDQGFHLPNYVDYAATLLWAITGALVAARRGYDIAGIAAVALVASTGGGLLRDGIFLQQGPPALLRTQTYFILIGVATLGVVLFGQFVVRIESFDVIITLVDSVGIGSFALVGLQLSRDAGLSAEAAVFVGVVNAVGGGVLRDLLVRRDPDIFRPGVPTALAALFCCLLFLTLTKATDIRAGAAAWIAILTVLVARGLALRFDVRTRTVAGLFDEPTS